MSTIKKILFSGLMLWTMLNPVSISRLRADEKPKPHSEVKSYTFAAKIADVTSLKDGKTSILFHLEEAPILWDDFRVLFDSQTCRAERAWWMTKGMFPINVTKEEKLLERIPEKGAKVWVVFDRDLPRDTTYLKGDMTLLSLAIEAVPTPPAK